MSTFPRKNSFNTTQNNGITGSINEESGSVIETVAVTPTNSVIVREPPTIPKTHHLLVIHLFVLNCKLIVFYSLNF